MFAGCSFYLFDINYYKSKNIAKKYSGVYVINKKLYAEIQQNINANKDKKLALQNELESKWQNLPKDSKEKYISIASNLSGYKNPKNAKNLFVIDSINKVYPQVLSDNIRYYDMLSLDSKNSPKIPQDIESKINKLIENDTNFKLQRVIYPQYYYINDKGEISLISVVVVYLYTNINKVYGLKTDSNITFANGEWRHLLSENVFYLD